MATKKTEDIAAELIKKGKDIGFVTQDDVLALFPEAENQVEELDNLYTKLAEEGIDVLEVGTDEEVKPGDLEKELEVLTSLGEAQITDPVRMYLKDKI